MKVRLFIFLLSFPIVAMAVCEQKTFENCMDTTCYSDKTGICLCHSDLRKNTEKMVQLSDSSKEIEKIVSNELGQVANGETDVDINSRLKRIKRLLSTQEDTVIPSFDDDILGEEMMPAESFGTDYGKTKLTSAWESCKSFINSCDGDSKLLLKNYLQKAQQSCSKLEKHLEKETLEVQNSLETARKLFEKTKSRKNTADITNSGNCKTELEGCMRKNCKGIFYLKCYKDALCETTDCSKKLIEIFENEKNNCSTELGKCGVNKSKIWDKFLVERTDYISEFKKKSEE